MGDDGRRYLFDLYRLNPIDIEFQERECIPDASKELPHYPHKLTLLRPELIEFFWDHKCRAWAKEKLLDKQKVIKWKIKNKVPESYPIFTMKIPLQQQE